MTLGLSITRKAAQTPRRPDLVTELPSLGG